MHPYKLIGLIFGGFGLLFGGFMLIGLLLPGGWTAVAEIEVAAPPEEVFALVDNAESWTRWTPSPETGVELFGAVAGPGSGRRWEDPAYGRGEFVIGSSRAPREVVYEVQVEDGAILIHGRISLAPVPGGTRIVWSEEGDFGWNPLLGYLAPRMSELQGEQLSASLSTLKTLVETEVRSRLD